MKKLFFALILAAVLSIATGAAFAQSNNAFPPSDLPSDHWAWSAVKYMMETGILEGYPGNEFQGSRYLTRYEFAIALNRVVAYIEKTGGGGADVQATLAALESEFGSELADIRSQVDANTASISTLESTVEDLGLRVDDAEKRIGNIKWSGDFRYRWQFDDADAGSMERFRERVRLRLNFEAPIVEDMVTFKGRLATGPGGTSTNQTLGNYLNNYGFGLDRAYLEYKASWLPVQNKFYFGRFPNIFASNEPNGIIWDGDVNFDGTGQSFSFPQLGGPMFGNWSLNAVQAILAEKSGEFFDDDEWMLGWQLAGKDIVTPRLNAYISYYHYQNLVGGGNNFGADMYKGNLAGGGVDVNLDGALNNLDSLATKYNVLNVGLNYTYKPTEDSVPILLHGDYVANLTPEIPFGVDTRFQIEDEDHVGWSGGFQYGKAKEPRTWDFGYYYKSVGATAVVGNFADADDVGTNVNMHNLYFDYVIAKNTSFTFEYILRDLKNDFGYLANNTTQTLILDLIVKF